MIYNLIYELVLGYEMKQLTLQAMLSRMRAKFQHSTSWINHIALKKWTWTYDGRKIYEH